MFVWTLKSIFLYRISLKKLLAQSLSDYNVKHEIAAVTSINILSQTVIKPRTRGDKTLLLA